MLSFEFLGEGQKSLENFRNYNCLITDKNFSAHESSLKYYEFIEKVLIINPDIHIFIYSFDSSISEELKKINKVILVLDKNLSPEDIIRQISGQIKSN